MHALLPSLGADLFQALMGEVQGALSRVGAPSRAVEDYVDKIQFLGQVGGGEDGGRHRQGKAKERDGGNGRVTGEKRGGLLTFHPPRCPFPPQSPCRCVPGAR